MNIGSIMPSCPRPHNVSFLPFAAAVYSHHDVTEALRISHFVGNDDDDVDREVDDVPGRPSHPATDGRRVGFTVAHSRGSVVALVVDSNCDCRTFHDAPRIRLCHFPVLGTDLHHRHRLFNVTYFAV